MQKVEEEEEDASNLKMRIPVLKSVLANQLSLALLRMCVCLHVRCVCVCVLYRGGTIGTLPILNGPTTHTTSKAFDTKENTKESIYYPHKSVVHHQSGYEENLALNCANLSSVAELLMDDPLGE